MENKWIVTASELYTVQQDLKELELRKKRLSEQLKRLSNNKTTHQGPYIFMASERRGPIDYMAIDLLTEVDLEQYRKDPVITWKLVKTEENQ